MLMKHNSKEGSVALTAKYAYEWMLTEIEVCLIDSGP